MKRTGPANHHAYALTGSRALEPEQHLWIAVLARALHDAFGITDYTESKRAVSWLGGNSRDFRWDLGYSRMRDCETCNSQGEITYDEPKMVQAYNAGYGAKHNGCPHN